MRPKRLLVLLRLLGLLALCGLAGIHAQSPLSYHFTSTREMPQAVICDSAHAQFFMSVPQENTVYVTSATTGALLAKIWVQSAFEMALSSDSSRLYVTGSPQTTEGAGVEGISVVDTAKLHVVDYVLPDLLPQNQSTGVPSYSPLHLVPRWLGVLSNQQIVFVANKPGISGGYVRLYNPTTGTATPVTLNFYDGTATSSANGSVAALYASGGGVSLLAPGSSSAFGTITPPSGTIGDMALSPDGSTILLGGRLLYSTSSQTLQATLAGAASTGFGGSTFSPDGTRIYVLTTLGGSATATGLPVVAVYSAASAQLLGYVAVPGSGNTGSYSVQYGALAADNAGHVAMVTNVLEGGDGYNIMQGMLQMDASAPSLSLAASSTERVGTLSTMAGTPTSPAAITISGSGFSNGMQVYFDNTPAATTVVSSTQLGVQPPAHAAGFATVGVFFPDGKSFIQPDAYTYGPSILSISVTAGSVSGGNKITISGYGLLQAGGPTMTIGGRSASLTAYSGGFGYSTSSFTTPAGSVGAADIVVTSLCGSVTLPGGFHYLQEQVVSGLAPLSMVADTARNKVYVADGNSGNVVAMDATSLSTTTLFSKAASPATALAMTPDGSKLVVVSYDGFSLDVINLATGKDILTTFTALGGVGGRYAPYKVSTTSRGTALVTVYDTLTYLQGATLEVNLSTGISYPLQPAGTFYSEPALTAASADGSLIYLTMDGSLGFSGGALDLWGGATDGLLQCCSLGNEADLTTDDLGDRVTGGGDTFDSQLRLVTAAQINSFYYDTEIFDVEPGVKLHSSGGLQYQPFTNWVEIVDTHHGNYDLIVADDAGSLDGPNNLATSHDGATLYVADLSGLRVISLGLAPLSIGSLTPATGNASGGTSVTLLGSGFTQSTRVSIDGNAATIQFVDSTRLQLVTPAVTAAKDAVTVTNADGTTYTLDAAFDARAQTATAAAPVLTSLTALYPEAGRDITMQITGSGFVPGATAYLDGQAAGQNLYISPTLMQANFYNLPGPETAAITASNPGSAVSNPLPLTVPAPYASTITLAPSSVQAGSGSFVLQVLESTGTGFAPNSVIQWNGVALPTTYVFTDLLLATVPASDVATAGTASVTTYSAQAQYGLTTSAPATFTITTPVPVLKVNATSATLGPVLAGNTATATITVTSAGQAALTLTGAILYSGSGYSVSSQCAGSVAPGQSCALVVSWTPAVGSSFTSTNILTISSNGGNATVTLSGSDGSVTMGGNSAPITVVAGRSGSTTVSGTSYGYVPASTLGLSCSGLPTGAACSFSPAAFTLAAGVAASQSPSSTLTITTTAPVYAANGREHTGVFLAGATVLCACLWRRRRKGALCLAALCGVLLSSGGCGGSTTANSGSGPSKTQVGGTPTGPYTVTVSATSGAASYTTTVNLNVQ